MYNGNAAAPQHKSAIATLQKRPAERGASPRSESAARLNRRALRATAALSQPPTPPYGPAPEIIVAIGKRLEADGPARLRLPALNVPSRGGSRQRRRRWPRPRPQR